MDTQTRTDETSGPLIGPAVQYPTPWRVAEKRGNHTIIVCADGHYTGEIPDPDLARLIVDVVNEAAAAPLTDEQRAIARGLQFAKDVAGKPYPSYAGCANDEPRAGRANDPEKDAVGTVRVCGATVVVKTSGMGHAPWVDLAPDLGASKFYLDYNVSDWMIIGTVPGSLADMDKA